MKVMRKEQPPIPRSSEIAMRSPLAPMSGGVWVCYPMGKALLSGMPMLTAQECQQGGPRPDVSGASVWRASRAEQRRIRCRQQPGAEP